MNKRLPAEWELQQLVLLSFPRKSGDFGVLTNEVAMQHLELCATICRFTTVLLIVADRALFEQSLAKMSLQTSESEHRIEELEAIADDVVRGFPYPLYMIELPTDDVWARDFGPITMLEAGKATICDFTFNGWGNKYPAELDNQITRALKVKGLFEQATFNEIPLVLEGGSIESDGAGTIMSTSKCLLNPERNPGLTIENIKNELKAALAADQILLLDHGHLKNDDTDAHIDTIARFAPDNAIVYQACDDPEDSHYADFQAMAAQLKGFKNTAGEAYKLYALPWPPPTHSQEDGRRLPAAYANFLITNGAVIVPAINEKSDLEAVAVLERAFPDHLIVLQPANYIVEQHGSIHCLTMQIPLIPECPVV